MYCAEFFDSTFWWVWPVVMITLCFFIMRRWRGPMMCGIGSRPNDWPQNRTSDSAMDILDKRFAAGEIDKKEYEEKRRSLDNRANKLKE